MDTFFDGYIEAALWSSYDHSTSQGGEPLDATYSFSDFAPKALQRMKADCDAFEKQNAALLEEFYAAGYDEAHAGHDFWLNRNGHGSGFWDERAPKHVTEGLSQACHAFGGQDIVVGDDRKLYAEGGRIPHQASLLKKNSTQQKQEQWEKAATRVRGLAITGSRKRSNRWDWQALNIALQAMKTSSVRLAAGLNEADARRAIKRITGKTYEELPASMKRGTVVVSVPTSMKQAHRPDVCPECGSDKVYGTSNTVELDFTKPETFDHIDTMHCSVCDASWAKKIVEEVGATPGMVTPGDKSLTQGDKADLKGMGISAAVDGWERDLHAALSALKILANTAPTEDLRACAKLSAEDLYEFYVDFREDSLKDSTMHEASAKVAMSRKDYILIADVLRQSAVGGADISAVMQKFVDALKRDNASFNAEHFISVVTGGKGLTSRPSRMNAV